MNKTLVQSKLLSCDQQKHITNNDDNMMFTI